VLSGGDKDWPGWVRRPGCSATASRASGSAIIGMGADRQAVARAALRASGLQIHYHNRRRLPAKIEEELARGPIGRALDQMLAAAWTSSSDQLSRTTPATFHLLSARRLKHSASRRLTWSNTARGEVIERERALIRMIRGGLNWPAAGPRRVRARTGGQSEARAALPARGKVVLLAAHGPRRRSKARHRHGPEKLDRQHPPPFMDGHKPPDRVLPSMLLDAKRFAEETTVAISILRCHPRALNPGGP